MTINIQIRDVYGKPTVYPACERSRIFARMLGQKTLTQADITNIKALGFEIVQVM